MKIEKGILTTVGEAAKIPNIVGKKIALVGKVEMDDQDSEFYKLSVSFSDKSMFSGCWLHKDIQIEVID